MPRIWGTSYGVGSAERNNGVVMLLALDNISQSGLMGDYCVVVGTGLESHADDFMSLQSYYLENDFAAGEYDAGVKATLMPSSAWVRRLLRRHDPGGVYPCRPGDLFQRQRVLLYGDPRLCGAGLWVPGERRCGAASGAAGAVGDPGRNAVLPLPPAVSAARYGTAHGAVLPHLLGTAPAAQATPSSKTGQSHRAGRPPAEHSAGAASAAAGEACSAEAPSGVPEGPGAASAEGPSGAAAAVAAVLRRLLPQRRGETRRLFPRAGAGKRQI